jgi:hypothetical protein
MSQSKHQPTTVAIGVLAVMLLFTVLYAAVYLWRWRQVRFVMDVSRGWGSTFDLHPKFPTPLEDVVFVPAVWVHRQTDPAAFDVSWSSDQVDFTP